MEWTEEFYGMFSESEHPSTGIIKGESRTYGDRYRGTGGEPAETDMLHASEKIL